MLTMRNNLGNYHCSNSKKRRGGRNGEIRVERKDIWSNKHWIFSFSFHDNFYFDITAAYCNIVMLFIYTRAQKSAPIAVWIEIFCPFKNYDRQTNQQIDQQTNRTDGQNGLQGSTYIYIYVCVFICVNVFIFVYLFVCVCVLIAMRLFKQKL